MGRGRNHSDRTIQAAWRIAQRDRTPTYAAVAEALGYAEVTLARHVRRMRRAGTWPADLRVRGQGQCVTTSTPGPRKPQAHERLRQLLDESPEMSAADMAEAAGLSRMRVYQLRREWGR